MSPRYALFLAAALGCLVGGAEAETLVLRSGNGSVGGSDAQVRMLVGPINGSFASAFTATDFANARGGNSAVIIAPHSLWIASLPSDPAAGWISTSAGGAVDGSTALYAIDFLLSDPFSSATLTLNFAVDNLLGSGPNQGVYLNGQALSGDTSTGNYSSQTVIFRDDIAPLLVAGLNTLYINATDQGGPSGLIFSATITTDAAVPEPTSLALLGCGALGALGLGFARRKRARSSENFAERRPEGR